MSGAFEVDVRTPGFGGSVVTIEQHPDNPGRVRLVVDVEDDHYSSETTLTAEQLDILLGVITRAAARG